MGIGLDAILSPLDRSLRLAHERVRRPRKTGIIAIHGIQRSGTNYLVACLKRIGVRPLNTVVRLQHSDPRHKHFRWQDDKATIYRALQKGFGNDLRADRVTDLNRLANYPERCSHLVIQKNKTDWLASICNWGFRVNWFGSVEMALDNLDALGRDYDAYYGFWRDLAARDATRVALLDLDELVTDLGPLLTALDGLGVRYKVPRGFAGQIATVPQSPADRPVHVSVADVRARLGMPCAG